MRKTLLAPLALLLLATQIATQIPAQTPPKRPMAFEDMMAMKRLGSTAVSPDGKWLVYEVTTMSVAENKGTREIFIQPIAGGDPKKLATTRPDDSGVQFSADGKRILYLSSRQGTQQVWTASFDTATGTAADETRLTSIATEADNAQWSPDGHSIVFTSTVYPDCPAITAADQTTGDKCNADRDLAAATSKVKAQIWDHLLYRHWNHYTGDKRAHLFLASVANGVIRDLTPNDPHDVPPFSIGGDGGFAFSPDSKELAFTENLAEVPAASTSASIFTLDLTNSSCEPVKVSTSKGGNFNPAYSPDGKYIAWRSQERAGYESDLFRLAVYERATKKEKNLLPKWDNWIDEFAWQPDAKGLVAVSGKNGSAETLKISFDGTWRTLLVGELSGLHIGPDRLIATWASVQSPAQVIQAAESTDAPSAGNGGVTRHIVLRTLTHLNNALLDQLDLQKMQDYWFTAKDGTKLQGFVIPPPAFDPAKKYPVKFLIHGGPQGAWGDAWSYRWNAELFAANGYVVVMVNPRGSTGYGQAVVDGVNGDWGGKPFTDLMTGLDEAERKFPFIDKSRECALGASYGGYMANWVLGHTDRFKCIVTHDGMFNPESAFGSTEELWFNEWEFKGHPWDYYGKPVDENPFEKWAPMRAAKNFKTPTLVVHGQLDYRLDVSEGFQLFTTLQLLHVPSKMLYFPDEGHWVLKPQDSQLWWQTVNAWVDQWTK